MDVRDRGGVVIGGEANAWVAGLAERDDLASCVVSADGTVRSVSDGLAALLGPDAARAPGRGFADVFAGWEASADAGGGLVLARTVDGVRSVFELRSGASGDLGDRIVVFADVTEQRRARRELGELAEFPRKNPGPVLWLDQEATVLRANPAALLAFGEDVVGACWLDRCPGMTEAIWGRAREATEPLVVDVDLGSVCYAMSYIASDDGDFVFTFGADISERRLVEKRLEEVARFPDMNPGPVLRLDLAGTILLANRAARDLFGEDITGGSWYELLPASAEHWNRITAAIEPFPLETRYADRDYLFAHRRDEHGDLVFVFGADVTAQKRAEQGFRQAERMATLGTLAAGIAHELNNPAAAARRAADQLRDAFERLQQAQFALDAAEVDDATRARLRDLDASARAHAESPSDLDAVTRSDREADIEDWLDDRDVPDSLDLAPLLVAQGLDADALDRLADALPEQVIEPVVTWAAAVFPVYRLGYEIGQASGRISEIVGAMKNYSYLGQAPRGEIDLHEGIDNTLVILRNKLKVGVDVRRDYCGDMPRILAFGSELNQVWTNLIDNAVDAMDGKGSITISTSTEDGMAIVRICDDGPGIPPEALPHVFDPFFTTKEPGKGTGLGLATTYSIVTDKHGGSIAVESEPGATCFTVSLPINNEELR